jgi:hypothetical protein
MLEGRHLPSKAEDCITMHLHLLKEKTLLPLFLGANISLENGI